MPFQCDRNVPGCSACVRRGVAHQCKWGDERDDFNVQAGRPSIDPATAALMARVTTLERHVKERDDELKRIRAKATQAGVDLESLESNTADATDDNPERLSTSASSSQKFLHSTDPRASPGPGATPKPLRSGQALSFHLDPPLPRGGLGKSEYDDDDEHGPWTGNEDGKGAGGAGNSSDDFGTEDTGKVLDELSRELIQAPSERMPDAGVNASYFKALRRANNQFDPAMQGSKRREVLGVPPAAPSTSSSRSNEEVEQKRNNRVETASSSNSNSNVTTNGMKDAVLEEANSMLKVLPAKRIRSYLVERYITDLQPMFPALHVPTFRKEYEALEELIEAEDKNKDREINLSTLALLFAILQGTCDCLSLEDMKSIGVAKSLDEAIPLLEGLHNSMARLLILDRFWLTPSLNGLQAFVISRHYYFNRNLHKHYSGQNLMAMRLAQTMGLHRLGSAEDDEKAWSEERALKERESQSQEASKPEAPEADSTRTLQEFLSRSTGLSIPKAKGKVKLHPFESSEEFGLHSHSLRETGRRIYTLICTLEWFLCTNASAPSAIRAGDSGVTTSLPLNIEDEDLDKSPLNPLPRDVPTDLSFLPIYTQISLTIARISEAINRGDSYRSVLAMHGELKAILDDLPFFFRYDNEKGMSEETEEEIVEREERNEWFEKRPILRFQRCLIHHFVNWRFLSLHRMYMSRGYRDPRYSLSTRSSISAASRLIKARLELARSMPDFYPPDWWSIRLHLFQAVATLQLDLLHYSTQPWNETMEGQQDLIGQGTAYLKSLIIAAGGGGVDESPLLSTLAALKEMIFSRRSSAAAAAAVPGQNPPSSAPSSSRAGIPQTESSERNSPKLRAAAAISTSTSKSSPSSSASNLSTAQKSGSGLSKDLKDPSAGFPILPSPLSSSHAVNPGLPASSPPFLLSPIQPGNRQFLHQQFPSSPQFSDPNPFQNYHSHLHNPYGGSSMHLDSQIPSPHETDAFISLLDSVMNSSAQVMTSTGGTGGNGSQGRNRTVSSVSSLDAAMPNESVRSRSQSHSNYEVRGGDEAGFDSGQLYRSQQQGNNEIYSWNASDPNGKNQQQQHQYHHQHQHQNS